MNSTTPKTTLAENKLGTAAFVRTLHAFLRGERSFLELLQDVDRLLATGEVSPNDLLVSLIDEDRRNPLSAAAFVALERRLRAAGSTEQTGDLEDEDHTLVEDDEDHETAVTRSDSLQPTLAASERAAGAGRFRSEPKAVANRPWPLIPLASGVAGLVAIGLALVLGAGDLAERQNTGSVNDAATVGGAAEPTAQVGLSRQDVTPEALLETQRQLQEVKDGLENRRAETESMRQQLKQVGVQLAERTAELETTRQGLRAAQSDQLGNTSEIDRLQSSVTELQALVDEQKREAETLRRGSEEQHADLRANLETLQRTEQELRQRLSERRDEAARLELAQTQAQLDQKQAAEEQTAGEIGRLESRVAELQAAVDAQKEVSAASKRDWQ